MSVDPTEVAALTGGGGLLALSLKVLADRFLKREDKVEHQLAELVREIAHFAGRLDVIAERTSARDTDMRRIEERLTGIGTHYGERVRELEQRQARIEERLRVDGSVPR